MNIRNSILDAIHEILEEEGNALIEELSDSSVLLESGLDSLGFAILVARLEENLGYDPFILMEEPVYPQTFKEFVDIYEKYKDHAGN